jgi:hypothetical protein
MAMDYSMSMSCAVMRVSKNMFVLMAVSMR